jgi:hypothetical protein
MTWEYVVLNQVFTKEECKEMSETLWSEFKNNNYKYDNQCLKSPAFSDALQDKYTQRLQEKLESILVAPVEYQFNYSRIYFKDEILLPHKDKSNCKYNFSVTLDYYSGDVWPLFLYSNKEQQIIKLSLDQGDVLLYKGTELLHWRTPFTNTWQTQAFWFFNNPKTST